MVKSLPKSPLFWTSKAYACFSSRLFSPASSFLPPKKYGFLPFTSVTVASLSSSPFNTTKPSGAINSKISVFAFNTPSLSPRFSKWHWPIFVITQTFGLAILLRRRISPKSLMPISTTATSCSFLILKMVRGSPTSLLKFPWVFNTLYFAPNVAAIISLVLVFPTLPVIPTTGMVSCSL